MQAQTRAREAGRVAWGLEFVFHIALHILGKPSLHIHGLTYIERREMAGREREHIKYYARGKMSVLGWNGIEKRGKIGKGGGSAEFKGNRGGEAMHDARV